MYIALHLGRYGDIIMMHRFRCCDEALEDVRTWTEECESNLKHIRDMLMPDLRNCTLNGANRGIFQPIVDDRARDAYDMLQYIRYKYAWYKKPEGGQGVDFYLPMIRGRYPEPKCRAYGGDCVDVELSIISAAADARASRRAGRMNNRHTGPAEGSAGQKKTRGGEIPLRVSCFSDI